MPKHGRQADNEELEDHLAVVFSPSHVAGSTQKPTSITSGDDGDVFLDTASINALSLTASGSPLKKQKLEADRPQVPSSILAKKKAEQQYIDTGQHRAENRQRTEEIVEVFLPKKSLKVKLSFDGCQQRRLPLYYQQLHRSLLTIGNLASDRYNRSPFTAPEMWDHEKSRLKFHASPYPEFLNPTPQAARLVYERLQKWEDEHFGINIDPQGHDLEPGVEATASVSVDTLARVFLAQTTSNHLALVVQDLLRQAFPYIVIGKQVVGKIPNWHKVRTSTQAELIRVVRGAGIVEKRTMFIKYMLQLVYNFHVAMAISGNGGTLPTDLELGQEPNTPEFVPGILSVDFLLHCPEKMAWAFLLNLHGMGIKSAACLMAFNLHRDVIAVDTHIAKMCSILGWVPAKAMNNNDQMFRHIMARIPKELMHALHQLFWHHPQHCKRCYNKITSPPSPGAAGKDICPLEDLVDRSRGPKSSPAEDSATDGSSHLSSASASPLSLATVSDDIDVPTTPTKKLRASSSKKPSPRKPSPKKLTGHVKMIDWCYRGTLSDEEAAARGMVLGSAPIDNDFGTGRIVKHLEYWYTPQFWMWPVGQLIDLGSGGADGFGDERRGRKVDEAGEYLD
ncbi:putative DNA glycosylase [Cyphellophora attinorum]|uniref:Putative DNA glycosylase n=1 Tax=Cyphellophora attinorum TaxID=1664694 RepID=A0A0N1HCF3_9EURO|nr:putative DNA glycosylase [Phialophora attinorum]KPI42010.1 putative DNA glycosylase [Phialophora attinorum]